VHINKHNTNLRLRHSHISHINIAGNHKITDAPISSAENVSAISSQWP